MEGKLTTHTAATLNRKNIKARNILFTLIVFILLFISPMTLAEKDQRSCSLEVSLMAERIKDENPEKDWSFVILTGSGNEKTYHRVKVVSQKKSNQSLDKRPLLEQLTG